MKKAIYYAIALFIIFSGFIITTACEKEEIKQTLDCNCYELHEVLEPVNVGGVITVQWVHDYESTTIQSDCSNDDGIWHYEGQSNRYRLICE